MSGHKFSLDVPVREAWENVEHVRATLEAFLSTFLVNAEQCEALSMTAGELLENAVKYGAWGGDAVFRLRVLADQGEASVSVEHPLRDAEDLARLRDSIAWIEGQPSPEAAYRARLLAVAEQKQAPGGIGLVRIYYEGGFRLGLEHDATTLRVVARKRFEP